MGKTHYTKEIVDNYVVLDTETTGLSAYYDEIIEIGILRVRNNQIVAKFSQLIKPVNEIDPFITSLTGITNEMVVGMPSIIDIKEDVLTFLGDDIIIGHNTSFDMRFLNEGFETVLENQYMDTMQFSRKVFPELAHHRLTDMAQYLHLSNNEHRSLADCITTKELYDTIKNTMAEKGLRIEDLWSNHHGRHSGKKIDISSIVAVSENVDPDGFFYNKHVVFTGKLEKMLRKDAMQIVVNLGGILDNSVNKSTNFLILGDNDYNAILHGEKSSKHKKAERLKLDGYDIDIIDEKTFYDIISDEITESHDIDTAFQLKSNVPINSENISKTDWKYSVYTMLESLEIEYKLPRNSLWLSDNKSRNDSSQIISHSVCIWEPDYPSTGSEQQEMNKIVMTISPSTVQSRPDDLDFYIRDSQFQALHDDIPDDAIVLQQTKSDTDTRTVRVRFNKNSKSIVDFVREHTRFCIDHYESKAGSFGCCNACEECSDKLRCVHENLLYSKACIYRSNLEQGRVFYGKNRNVD